MAKDKVAGVTSSKPTQAAAAEKVKKTKRVKHPNVGSKDAKVYPFSAIPTDFDFKTHANLKKKDFTDGALFFEFKAQEMENKAKMFREKAAEEKLTGGGKQKQKAKRFLKMMDKMDELKKQLAEQGINPEELIAQLKKDKAAAATPAK